MEDERDSARVQQDSQTLTLLPEMEEGHPWPVVEEGKMEGLSKIEILLSLLSCLAGCHITTQKGNQEFQSIHKLTCPRGHRPGNPILVPG